MFFVFGRALQTLSRTDPILQRELGRWPEDFLVLYKILPDGPRLVLLRDRQGRLRVPGKPGPGRGGGPRARHQEPGDRLSGHEPPAEHHAGLRGAPGGGQGRCAGGHVHHQVPVRADRLSGSPGRLLPGWSGGSPTFPCGGDSATGFGSCFWGFPSGAE